MKEQLISYETAELAVEKGFDLKTDKYWINEYFGKPTQKWKLVLPDYSTDSFCNPIPAPTQSILQKWLRDIHDIVVTVNICNGEKGENIYCSKIYMLGYSDKYKEEFSFVKTSDFFTKYEEALERGLQEGLNLIR